MLKKALSQIGFLIPSGEDNRNHASHNPTEHGHHHGEDGHTHGVMDATIASTERGIYAIKWSSIIMFGVAAIELVIVALSGSVALLADMIHNFADATTAIPLFIAFRLARRKPTTTFNYGLGRVEDLAGLVIVIIILFSTIVAGYEAIERLLHPKALTNLGLVAAMGAVSYIGNEAVARLRIKIGREINSAALVADGHHARIDARTALAVIAGAFFVWIGFPLADPIVGLLITLSLTTIVWQCSRAVLVRMLDGVDPSLHDQVREIAKHVDGLSEVAEIKARWIGHKLHVDAAIKVAQDMSLARANTITERFCDELFAHLPALAGAHVRFERGEDESHADAHAGHSHAHHAPEPFCFDCSLAKGELSIIETINGERFSLHLTQHLPEFSAFVEIARASGDIETHTLNPDPQDHHRLISDQAPAEPHEFAAQLHIGSKGGFAVLPFTMQEPHDHKH